MKRNEDGIDFDLLLLFANFARFMNWDIMKQRGSSVFLFVRTLKSKESSFMLMLEELIILSEWSTIFDFSSSSCNLYVIIYIVFCSSGCLYRSKLMFYWICSNLLLDLSLLSSFPRYITGDEFTAEYLWSWEFYTLSYCFICSYLKN